MILPFHLRGFRGADPLDRLSPAGRGWLLSGITAGVTALLVYLISDAFALVDFHGWPLKVAEVLGFSLVAAPILLRVRRSSSLVLMAMVGAPLLALDLYLEAHYRAVGRPALWEYLPGTFITRIEPPVLRFLATMSFDGFIVGPFCLWLARLVAARLRPTPPGLAPDAPLFRAEWTDEAVPRPPRDAAFWILRLLAFGYLGYLGLLLVAMLGSSPWPEQVRFLFDMTYGNPLLAVDTVAKISLMIALAFVAAFNRRLRYTATLALALGHTVSVVTSLFFYAADAPGTPYRDFLLVSAIVDGVMVVLFIWILARSRRDQEAHAPEMLPSLFSLPVALWRIAAAAIAVLGGLQVAAWLFLRLAPPTGALGSLALVVQQPDPTLCNGLTLATTVAFIALLMRAHQELRDVLTTVLVRALSAGVLFGLVLVVAGPVSVEPAGGPAASIQSLFLVHLGLLALVVAALAGVRGLFYDVEYAITSFRAPSARAIAGIHDALFDPGDRSDVLQAIDRYAGGIRGRKRGLLNFPFWLIEDVLPMLFGAHPPFSAMSPEEQKYFLRRFLLRPEPERRRSFVPELAEIAHDLSVAAHSVVLFAVYSGMAGHARIQYVPPGARVRLQSPDPGPPPDAEVAPLPRDERDPANWAAGTAARQLAPRLSTPTSEPRVPDEVDYLVVGSGPGGAVMAHRLACEAPGARIAVLERGGRYSPRDDFNERELEMVAKLYKEGGLQQTKRADMFILQGECVGGGSVINNAVCFRMPPHIRKLWADEYGLPLEGLEREYDRTAVELGIGPLPARGINRRVEERFRAAVDGVNNSASARLSPVKAVEVNGPDARGDGLWNLGNKYFGKRSVLETYVPWAEARGVAFVPNATAVGFRRDGGRAQSMLVRTIGGRLESVRIKKGLVVSAGVIASSHLLMRSQISGPVGQGMSCNLAMPVAFELDQTLDAFDGEQITLGAIDEQSRAIFETYFNPPGALALMIPFFFERHRSLMEAYRRLVMFGALIGSEPNGQVTPRADLASGQAFDWTLGTLDQENIRFALRVLLELGHHAGARRAVLPTRPGVELPLDPRSIDELCRCLRDRPLRTRDLLVNTAHPQGGNAMMDERARHAARQVVDGRFRVVGCDNVFVADASLFPTSITVNPQWTIMAMSSLAAQAVLEATR